MSQTPDKLNEEIREILNDLYVKAVAAGVNQYELAESDTFDERIAAITTAYAEAMNEIIGEDEPEEVTYFNSIRPVNINKWRNQLRAEQRQRLKGLLPNGKDE